MADQLNKVAKKLIQRTSTNTGKLRTEDERAAFSNNVRADLASIVEQLNTVYYPLVKTLMSEQTLNALDLGFSGNAVKTHITADAASATAYYDTALARARTIKETIDVLLKEIARLESLISQINNDGFDDSELQSDIDNLSLNLQQLAIDSMGSHYHFDNDGVGNMTYSLSQAVDAIGALINGWPTLGNTYSTSFPSISLQILLSNVTLDTTIPESTIADLVDDLTAIRTFVGMDTSMDNSPDYSDYGSLVYLVDGDSLEESLWKLDQAIGTAALPSFPLGRVLFGDGTNLPVVDSTFYYNASTKRLGLGTTTPEQALDIRGIIQHTGGVLSRGGNARGAGASDFQITRAGATQVASGDSSFIAGGEDNTASGKTTVVGGKNNLASADSSTAFGENCTASGGQAVAIGHNAVASGPTSSAFGDNVTAQGAGGAVTGLAAKSRLRGERAFSSGLFDHSGDSQVSEFVVRNQTIGVGPFELFLDGVGVQILLEDNTSYGVVANVVSRDATGLTNHYVLEGTIKKGAAPGTTTLVGAVTQRVIAEEVALNDATIVADAGTDAVVIQVTGSLAGASTRWVAHVTLTNSWYA